MGSYNSDDIFDEVFGENSTPATPSQSNRGFVKVSLNPDNDDWEEYRPATPKKKWPKIALAAVLAIALIGLLIALLPSGSSQNSEAALYRALEAYIAGEKSEGENLPTMLQYQNKILSAITFDIQSYQVNNGRMTVEFSYVDVLALADSIDTSDLSADEYYSLCMERINQSDCATKTETIEVHFQASKSGYTIMQSAALTNVISGGVLYHYLDALEGIRHE